MSARGNTQGLLLRRLLNGVNEARHSKADWHCKRLEGAQGGTGTRDNGILQCIIRTIANTAVRRSSNTNTAKNSPFDGAAFTYTHLCDTPEISQTQSSPGGYHSTSPSIQNAHADDDTVDSRVAVFGVSRLSLKARPHRCMNIQVSFNWYRSESQSENKNARGNPA